MRFLNTVKRRVAADKPIHVVLDNYATHKHPRSWPGWRVIRGGPFHFTPISVSWLNAVEHAERGEQGCGADLRPPQSDRVAVISL